MTFVLTCNSIKIDLNKTTVVAHWLYTYLLYSGTGFATLEVIFTLQQQVWVFLSQRAILNAIRWGVQYHRWWLQIKWIKQSLLNIWNILCCRLNIIIIGPYKMYLRFKQSKFFWLSSQFESLKMLWFLIMWYPTYISGSKFDLLSIWRDDI